MDVSEIRDIESLEAWLKDRPRLDALLLAHRAAARAFPMWGLQVSIDHNKNPAAQALGVLRGLAITKDMLEGRAVEKDFGSTASVISRSIAPLADQFSRAEVSAALSFDANGFTILDPNSLQSSSADEIYKSIDQEAAAGRFWSSVRGDCTQILTGADLTRMRLWLEEPPAWFTLANKRVHEFWAREPEHWEFWIRWWDSVINGDPLPDQLLHDIALISDDIWKQGPGPVAVEIRRLEEREALRREVAELRTQLAASQDALVAGPAHRGHNNPPEMIDLPTEVREAGAEIAAQLEIVSVELAKPRQSSAVLRKAGAALVAGARTILLYCGRKADAVLDHALKPLGLALGTQAAAWLSGVTWEQVMAFGNALIEFAAKWPWP